MSYNPYVQKDINTIIDAYTKPGMGDEIVKDYVVPGRLGFQQVKNIGSGTGYSIAEMSNKLQSYMDTAKGAVETVYSYGTFSREDRVVGQALGVEFSNTLLTMTQAGDIWEAGATLLADCIPCQDRILALLSLNPIEDVWEALDKVYRLMARFVVDLFDFFLGDKSLGVFADLCHLLQFLSFMCVPDLTAMTLVLTNLISKYMLEIKDINASIQNLVGKLVGSSLSPLLALLDRYIQLIIAPVDCVVGEVNHIIERISGKEQKGIDPDNKAVQSVAAPFILLRKYLQQGSDAVKETIDKLKEDVMNMLKLEDDVNGELFSLTGDIQKVTQLIGLIHALVLAISNGGFTCNNTAAGQEELSNFVNNYIAPNSDIDIVASNGEINIRASIPPELDGIEELVDVIGTYKMERQSRDLPSTSETDRYVSSSVSGNSAGSLNTTVQVAEVAIPIKNCLYSVQDKELDKVKDFLSTFK